MQELHSCRRGQSSMEEYPMRFDAAVHACDRDEVGVPKELLPHQVLQQANLTHDPATVIMSTVKSDALTRGVVTYQEMQAALTLLHGQQAKAFGGNGHRWLSDNDHSRAPGAGDRGRAWAGGRGCGLVQVQALALRRVWTPTPQLPRSRAPAEGHRRCRGCASGAEGALYVLPGAERDGLRL